MKHNIRIPQDLLHGLLGRAGIARRLSGGTRFCTGGTPLIDSPARWKNGCESRSLARMLMDAAKTMAMRIGASGIWRWKQRIAGLALLASVGPVASPAMAQTLVKSNVLDGGYTDCSYSVQGDTVSIKFKTRFNPASGHTNDAFFAGRVLLINTYDASGKPIPISPGEYWEVYVNGEKSTLVTRYRDYLVAGPSTGYPGVLWSLGTAFDATFELKASKTALSIWPAVAMWPGNSMYGRREYVVDSSGAVYIGSAAHGCTLLSDPALPPPSPVSTEIKVYAPDWDLGELNRGKETVRTFTSDSERLCFRYDPTYIEFDKYLIDASNHNGVVDNRFLLIDKNDAGQTVPYTLTLTGGGAPVALPGIAASEFALAKSGVTCLTPTFRAWADAGIKDGDFSDVLTFTITTKP